MLGETRKRSPSSFDQSFDAAKISENTDELLQTIMKLKPTSSKGVYIQSIALSSTMGVGVAVESKSLI